MAARALALAALLAVSAPILVGMLIVTVVLE